MHWRKLGWIYNATGAPAWRSSHAMIPTADHLDNDRFRIYFAPRDERNRSNIGSLIIDLNNPTEVLEVSPDPVLTCGPLGTFDDSGVLASSVITHDGTKYLYYIGYNIGVTVGFRNYIGLACIIDRTHVDPYLAVTPFVIKEGNLWRMWYTSGTQWRERTGDKPRHYYHIKYATSADGIQWERSGLVCIDYANASEYAIARPSVIRDGDTYRMWFCCRGDKYRLGYAESEDGLTWRRDDARAGLTVSSDGWDSEMVAYPFVFAHHGAIYMLYNGNGYGQTGFGIAVLER
jgi:predicted GH43/DUF377 family glycosyl hydrolase